MRKRSKRVNKVVVAIVMIISILFLSSSKPLYGKAAQMENVGNLVGMKEQLIYMQQDLQFLHEEIEKLGQECER